MRNKNYKRVPPVLTVFVLILSLVLQMISPLAVRAESASLSMVNEGKLTYITGAINTTVILQNGNIMLAGGGGRWEIITAAGTSVANGKWANGATGSVVAATLLQNGDVMIAGPNGNWEIITPTGASVANGTWGNGTGIIRSATCLQNGDVFLTGDSGRWAVLTSSGVVVTKGTWSSGTSNIYASALLKNGDIIAAGANGNWEIITSAGVSVKSGIMRKGANSVHIRSVTLLQNGEVMLSGSGGNWEIITSDGASVASGTLTEITTGSVEAASLLPNGNIIFVGGTSPTSNGKWEVLTSSGTKVASGAWTTAGSSIPAVAVSQNGNIIFAGTSGNWRISSFITKYTITATYNNSSYGSVSGGGIYDANQTVTLTAIPNSGYVFDNWTSGGNVVSTSNPYVFTANSDATITANVKAATYNISTSTAGVGSGTTQGDGSYTADSVVTLKATPAPGSKFDEWRDWNGNTVSTNSSYTFNPTSDGTYTAHFSLTPYTITVNKTGNGTTTGGGSYTHNATVTLTATPSEGYQFTNWTDTSGAIVSSDQRYSFAATENRTLTANFTAITYTIIVNVNGPGTATGTGAYNNGQPVTLAATPNANAFFKNWTDGSGNIISTNLTYSFTASMDRVLTANFALKSYTINATGTNGTVTGGGTYNPGDTVTLTATPDPEYSFVKWVEGSTNLSTNPSLTFTATSNRTITAQFAKNGYIVKVEASTGGTATGGGTFGISTQATVVATPKSGYAFLNWTNNDGTIVLSTDPSYTFTVTQNVTLKANFTSTTNIPTNISWEKTQYGTYRVTWQGPSLANVTLQNGAAIAYKANGFLNAAVFASSISSGSYEIFVSGIGSGVMLTASNSTSVPGEGESPDTKNPTDVTFEKTQYGTYQVTWKGNAKAAAELKQDGVTAYKANGSLNKAVFQATTAPGEYNLFIDGVEVQAVTIETEDKPDQPTNPGTNNPTDVTFEKTQYGTYQVKWKGNAKAAVELKQDGVTAYKANGSLNKAVFQATTAPGEYNLFIDGVEVQTVTIE